MRNPKCLKKRSEKCLEERFIANLVATRRAKWAEEPFSAPRKATASASETFRTVSEEESSEVHAVRRAPVPFRQSREAESIMTLRS